MLPFGITATEFAVVTYLSAFAGISAVIVASAYVRVRYLAAFALGVYLWFFTDTLSGANYLDVNGGFALSGALASLLLLFVIGLASFLAVDRRAFTAGESTAFRTLWVGGLAALALGLHGMAEGAAFGITAAQTPSNSLLDAFGGLTPSVSWVLHKMLEPSVAAVAYLATAGPGSRKWMNRLVDAVVLAAIFVIPAVAGSVIGYFTAFDFTYVYALGLGASVYALARVGRSLYAEERADSWLSLKMALAASLGFILIFIAALMHS